MICNRLPTAFSCLPCPYTPYTAWSGRRTARRHVEILIIGCRLREHPFLDDLRVVRGDSLIAHCLEFMMPRHFFSTGSVIAIHNSSAVVLQAPIIAMTGRSVPRNVGPRENLPACPLRLQPTVDTPGHDVRLRAGILILLTIKATRHLCQVLWF